MIVELPFFNFVANMINRKGSCYSRLIKCFFILWPKSSITPPLGCSEAANRIKKTSYETIQHIEEEGEDRSYLIYSDCSQPYKFMSVSSSGSGVFDTYDFVTFSHLFLSVVNFRLEFLVR
jgi:hypothetical protein